jgi:hypothetical protein
MTYDVECQSCGVVKEIHCSYDQRNNLFPCDCGGDCKKIVSNFALGAGMYNQKIKSNAQRSDQMAELRSMGIEKISASTQNFDNTFRDLKKNSSQVIDQMKAGEERQKKNLAEKVKASTPSASEVKRLERIYEKKNVPRGTNKKPK